MKPQILTSNRKIKIRAGNPLSVPIEFVGAPAPEVNWSLAGQPLTQSDHLIIDSRPMMGTTSLYFPSAKRYGFHAFDNKKL